MRNPIRVRPLGVQEVFSLSGGDAAQWERARKAGERQALRTGIRNLLPRAAVAAVRAGEAAVSRGGRRVVRGARTVLASLLALGAAIEVVTQPLAGPPALLQCEAGQLNPDGVWHEAEARACESSRQFGFDPIWGLQLPVRAARERSWATSAWDWAAGWAWSLAGPTDLDTRVPSLRILPGQFGHLLQVRYRPTSPE